MLEVSSQVGTTWLENEPHCGVPHFWDFANGLPYALYYLSEDSSGQAWTYRRGSGVYVLGSCREFP